MRTVYILECADQTLYTGITLDKERRLDEHNQDNTKGAKYTKMRRPVKLVWHKEFSSRSKASKEEYRIKHLTKSEKHQLILYA